MEIHPGEILLTSNVTLQSTIELYLTEISCRNGEKTIWPG